LYERGPYIIKDNYPVLPGQYTKDNSRNNFCKPQIYSAYPVVIKEKKIIPTPFGGRARVDMSMMMPMDSLYNRSFVSYSMNPV
jgi:hypothetical protein